VKIFTIRNGGVMTVSSKISKKEIINELDNILSKTNLERENLLCVLEELVRKFGYLNDIMAVEVGKRFGVDPNEVYSVASFYAFLPVKKSGKYKIRICRTISCKLKNADKIVEAIEDELGIKFGGTTKDMRFTLERANCLGMCDKAPAMLINDKVYTELTPEKAKEIIRSYKNK
jgi:NADH:ubiquinone oxidoreductase subunit E